MPFELAITAQSGGLDYMGGDPLIEGTDLILICGGGGEELNGSVEFSWEFSSLLNLNKIHAGQGNMLIKYPLLVEDSGEYICTARWGDNVIELGIFVNVYSSSEANQAGGTASQRSESEQSSRVIIALCVVLVLMVVAAIGFGVYKFRKDFKVGSQREYSSFSLPMFLL